MLSKIFYGKRGSNFEKVTFPFVRKALCTGSQKNCECYSCSLAFSAHPDLMILDKDSYLVDDVDAIVVFAESAPLISNRRVVLMNNLSSVTEISQNKLLKALEDNSAFVFAATADSGKNTILPTIKSRTESIFLGAESKEDFKESLAHSMNETEDIELLYGMTGGYSGLVSEMKEQVDIYGAVKQAFIERSKGKLFDALNLVIDKDKECYYEKYSNYLPQLFDYMGRLALGGDDLVYSVRLLEVINKEKSASLSNTYSRIGFFTSIANIGEVL